MKLESKTINTFVYWNFMETTLSEFKKLKYKHIHRFWLKLNWNLIKKYFGNLKLNEITIWNPKFLVNLDQNLSETSMKHDIKLMDKDLKL